MRLNLVRPGDITVKIGPGLDAETSFCIIMGPPAAWCCEVGHPAAKLMVLAVAIFMEIWQQFTRGLRTMKGLMTYPLIMTNITMENQDL